MNPPPSQSALDELRREHNALFAQELKRLNDEIVENRNRITQFEREMGAIQVKAGIWGVIGGVLTIAIPFVLYALLQIMKTAVPS